MTRCHRHGISYENALRSVGRHLDARPSYHVTIVEDDDGFTIRYQPAQHRMGDRVEHLGWPQLQSLGVLHAAARHGSKQRRHQGLWANFPTGHEDFFRALGHQLDDESADTVTIDEVGGGVLVTFLSPDENGHSTRYLLYGKEEIERLLLEAVARRGQSVRSVS